MFLGLGNSSHWSSRNVRDGTQRWRLRTLKMNCHALRLATLLLLCPVFCHRGSGCLGNAAGASHLVRNACETSVDTARLIVPSGVKHPLFAHGLEPMAPMGAFAGACRRRRTCDLAVHGPTCLECVLGTDLFWTSRHPKWARNIVTLAIVLAVTIGVAFRVDRPAAWMLVPYLGWIAYASSLNAAIAILN